MTKTELINYFSSLDSATLEKLKKYSELLIIPDEDLVTNVTMTQMLEKAHTLADSLFPEWTDRSKSDFGEFLVELFCLFSEKDFWYINAHANESLLRKTRTYSNAYSLAASLGYQATLCKGAKASFSVTFSAGEATTYHAGELSIRVLSKTFVNYEDIVVAQSSVPTSQTVSLVEGTYVSTNNTYNGFKISLTDKNIDIDSISVVIDDTNFTKVGTFGFSNSDSAHFIVVPEENAEASIYFGSDGFGITPPIGKSIDVSYRVCSGYKGNIAIGDCLISDSLASREATSASMITPAIGGSDQETLTSLRESAPSFFYNKKTAVNASVTEEILDSLVIVKRSKVTTIGKNVFYRVIPSSGNSEPTASEVAQINSEISPLLIEGYILQNTANDYQDLVYRANSSATALVLNVIASRGYDKTVIESLIRGIMDDVTNPMVGATYGSSFVKSSMDIAIKSRVSGVQSVTYNVLVEGSPVPFSDVMLSPTQIFSPIDQSKLLIYITMI